MRSIGQIVIALVLLWAHMHFDGETSTVRTSNYRGIPPITERSLPLSADDVIRGLSADSTIPFDGDTFEKAHALRQEFARQKANRDVLELTLGEQTILLITTMRGEQ